MAETPDRHHLEGVTRRQRTVGVPWPLIAIVLAILLLVALFYTPLFRPVGRVLPEAPSDEGASDDDATTVVAPDEPIIPPILSEPPLPAVTRVATGTDLQVLSKDVDLMLTFEASEGGLASIERSDRTSYTANYTLHLRVPKAAQTLTELLSVDDQLAHILPDLETMTAEAEISPWYDTLYVNKTKRMKKNLRRLDTLLTRHNFYDCQTMLNLTHPDSKQRVFLMQAEMDVVSDGSDGDRLAEMPEDIVNSTHYQPFTSYNWPKRTETPNPMVEGWVTRIGNADRELTSPETSRERKSWLQERKKYLERGIADMKRRSYLIADYDPFVVMPVNIITDRKDPFAPNVGDYVIVIYNGKVYPAIVGDGGPTFKVGEASLRMAKEINRRSSPYSRPVSDLTVTYVVFPRSADSPWRVPDYVHWKMRCEELLEKVGGLGEGYSLHEWEDLFPKAEEEVLSEEAEGSE